MYFKIDEILGTPLEGAMFGSLSVLTSEEKTEIAEVRRTTDQYCIDIVINGVHVDTTRFIGLLIQRAKEEVK